MSPFLSLYAMATLAVLTGGALILGALYLLYKRRISLDSVVKNPALQAAAMKIEIEKLVNISTNVPALGLFLVGFSLVIAGLLFGDEESKRSATRANEDLKSANAEVEKLRAQLNSQRAKLNVMGAIAKSDRSSPLDVEVQMRWPPFHPDSSGKLNGLTVQRDGDGRLPVLAFLHPQYDVITLDLNVEAKVEGNDIVVPSGQVVLKKIPGAGGKE